MDEDKTLKSDLFVKKDESVNNTEEPINYTELPIKIEEGSLLESSKTATLDKSKLQLLPSSWLSSCQQHAAKNGILSSEIILNLVYIFNICGWYSVVGNTLCLLRCRLGFNPCLGKHPTLYQ